MSKPRLKWKRAIKGQYFKRWKWHLCTGTLYVRMSGIVAEVYFSAFTNEGRQYAWHIKSDKADMRSQRTFSTVEEAQAAAESMLRVLLGSTKLEGWVRLPGLKWTRENQKLRGTTWKAVFHEPLAGEHKVVVQFVQYGQYRRAKWTVYASSTVAQGLGHVTLKAAKDDVEAYCYARWPNLEVGDGGT